MSTFSASNEQNEPSPAPYNHEQALSDSVSKDAALQELIKTISDKDASSEKRLDSFKSLVETKDLVLFKEALVHANVDETKAIYELVTPSDEASKSSKSSPGESGTFQAKVAEFLISHLKENSQNLQIGFRHEDPSIRLATLRLCARSNNTNVQKKIERISRNILSGNYDSQYKIAALENFDPTSKPEFDLIVKELRKEIDASVKLKCLNLLSHAEVKDANPIFLNCLKSNDGELLIAALLYAPVKGNPELAEAVQNAQVTPELRTILSNMTPSLVRIKDANVLGRVLSLAIKVDTEDPGHDTFLDLCAEFEQNRNTKAMHVAARRACGESNLTQDDLRAILVSFTPHFVETEDDNALTSLLNLAIKADEGDASHAAVTGFCDALKDAKNLRGLVAAMNRACKEKDFTAKDLQAFSLGLTPALLQTQDEPALESLVNLTLKADEGNEHHDCFLDLCEELEKAKHLLGMNLAVKALQSQDNFAPKALREVLRRFSPTLTIEKDETILSRLINTAINADKDISKHNSFFKLIKTFEDNKNFTGLRLALSRALNEKDFDAETFKTVFSTCVPHFKRAKTPIVVEHMLDLAQKADYGSGKQDAYLELCGAFEEAKNSTGFTAALHRASKEKGFKLEAFKAITSKLIDQIATSSDKQAVKSMLDLALEVDKNTGKQEFYLQICEAFENADNSSGMSEAILRAREEKNFDKNTLSDIMRRYAATFSDLKDSTVIESHLDLALELDKDTGKHDSLIELSEALEEAKSVNGMAVVIGRLSKAANQDSGTLRKILPLFIPYFVDSQDDLMIKQVSELAIKADEGSGSHRFYKVLKEQFQTAPNVKGLAALQGAKDKILAAELERAKNDKIDLPAKIPELAPRIAATKNQKIMADAITLAFEADANGKTFPTVLHLCKEFDDAKNVDGMNLVIAKMLTIENFSRAEEVLKHSLGYPSDMLSSEIMNKYFNTGATGDSKGEGLTDAAIKALAGTTHAPTIVQLSEHLKSTSKFSVDRKEEISKALAKSKSPEMIKALHTVLKNDVNVSGAGLHDQRAHVAMAVNEVAKIQSFAEFKELAKLAANNPHLRKSLCEALNKNEIKDQVLLGKIADYAFNGKKGELQETKQLAASALRGLKTKAVIDELFERFKRPDAFTEDHVRLAYALMVIDENHAAQIRHIVLNQAYFKTSKKSFWGVPPIQEQLNEKMRDDVLLMIARIEAKTSI